MLTRLAACFVSFGLLSGAAAGAHGFAQPPHQEEVSVALPIRVFAPHEKDVRKALEKRRAKNLAAFRAYRKGGVYPHNFFRPGPLNVWIDQDGHLCAAATMIAKDGHRELVDATGKTNNQIRLLNVIDGELMDWMLTSGFTIEEIDRIQVPGFGQEEWRRERDWTAEDNRLRGVYAATDAFLVKNAKKGLDKAVKRLMQNPELAQKLVDETL